MKVVISDRARREFERCDEWWRANRDAKTLLAQEMLELLDRLATHPGLGSLYAAERFEMPVRRVLLPKTEFHVYHSQVGDTVTIVAIWGARRRRGPKL